MKIEICEQVIASWLRHVKGCQIVQTNWSLSPYWKDKIAQKDMEKMETAIRLVKKVIKEDELDIFKKSTPEQIVSQCEIDVAGIKIQDGRAEELYFVDSAFHENGLNYGDVVARVLKKILRGVFVADLAFRMLPVQILFVSPKCGETLAQELAEKLKMVKLVLKMYYPNVTTELVFNGEFTSKIFAPLIAASKSISDDNDLFLRSLRLLEIAKENAPIYKADPIQPLLPSFDDPIHIELPPKAPRGNNSEVVFGVLNGLQRRGLLTEKRLELLETKRVSSAFFKLPYPVLIKCADFQTTQYERRLFYSKVYFVGNTAYYVCSQWIPERIRLLTAWYEKLINEMG